MTHHCWYEKRIGSAEVWIEFFEGLKSTFDRSIHINLCYSKVFIMLNEMECQLLEKSAYLFLRLRLDGPLKFTIFCQHAFTLNSMN